MKKNMWTRNLLVLACALTVTALGCDALSGIKEYFKGKKSDNAAAPASQNNAPMAAQPASPTGPAVMTSSTLVRVGNWAMTIDEFNDRLKALKEVVPEFDINDINAKKMILEELVRQQLLVEDAQKNGLDQQKDFTAAMDEFRRTLLVREVARKLTEGITVTDEEAQKFYDDKKDLLIEPGEWHVREIVVADQLKANELSVQILKGDTAFADIAKQNSTSKSAANGGDLGFLKDTEITFPEMVNALLPLKVGEVSSPFKGPNGYYIVKVEEKKGGAPLEFSKIKEDIKQNQKLLKQQQAVLDYIEKLKQSTKIETQEKLLE